VNDRHQSSLSLLGLAVLSSATLLYEIALTRVYSVAQFYHFAFMIISLAMLGSGASGTFLALFPESARRRGPAVTYVLALAQALSVIGSYLLINLLPFDSYALIVDPKQLGVLLIHYLFLAVPFFCSGMVLGILLTRRRTNVGAIYAVNLAGGAFGCLLAIVLPRWLGGDGTLVFSGALSCLSALCYGISRSSGPSACRVLAASLLGAFILSLLVARPSFLSLRISPYKALSYAMQYPGADIVYQQWNAFSRVDVVESQGIRSLPGISYRYEGALPSQRGLFVDADNMNPIIEKDAAGAGAQDWSSFMPTALAYQLRPGGDVLVLNPEGGLEIEVALAQGARSVTAVAPNPLTIESAGATYRQPSVIAVVEEPRSHVLRSSESYDVVALPLTESYHPVRSGAYSLSEDYSLTVEAFQDYLRVLGEDGILVATRWLQIPPSESLRLFVLAVNAVKASGGSPEAQIVAFRGFSTMTLLVKRSRFERDELAALWTFVSERAFDVVLAPDLEPGKLNRCNVLEEPLYHNVFEAYLHAPDGDRWLADYEYDVTPPTDERPFFGHYFRASQAGETVAGLGKTWQPFGGAGYLALVTMAGVALLAAVLIILLPLTVVRRNEGMVGPADRAEAAGRRVPRRRLAYFALIGLGYMLIEVPLIQRFIVFVGQPTYALASVLGGLLLFSGVGSLLSRGLGNRLALAGVVIVAVAYLWLLPVLFRYLLPIPQISRVLLSVGLVAPLGLLMGMPFAQGMRLLRKSNPRYVAWAWGVNGSASVVASVGASLLALVAGFHWVLVTGALCYSGAWVLSGEGSPPWGRSSSRTRGTKVT